VGELFTEGMAVDRPEVTQVIRLLQAERVRERVSDLTPNIGAGPTGDDHVVWDAGGHGVVRDENPVNGWVPSAGLEPEVKGTWQPSEVGHHQTYGGHRHPRPLSHREYRDARTFAGDRGCSLHDPSGGPAAAPCVPG